MLNTTPLRFALACGLATALGFGTPARTPAQQKAQTPTLIRNATLLTVTKGTLENSDLLIENGKIAKIGKGLTAPAGARVIDATGKYVLPGIIDCHSHSMIDAVNEGSLSVTSMCRIRDVLNPNDVDLYRALAGGVTTLNLLHGSANAIGGQNQVVKIKYGRPIEEFLFPDAPPGIKFALGENPKRSNFRFPGQTQRYPNSRMGVEETSVMPSCGRGITSDSGMTTTPPKPVAKMSYRPGGTCSLSRSLKFWKANATCMRTATAPKKS
jgi:hypothetical protein